VRRIDARGGNQCDGRDNCDQTIAAGTNAQSRRPYFYARVRTLRVASHPASEPIIAGNSGR
jgi:hypothetical protein